MSEASREQPLIMMALSKAGATIFRNNVGMGWTGKSIRQKDGSILILNPRPLHAGLTTGSSDLIGWKTITITPDMVGKRFAQFVAVEVKTSNGKPSKEQLHFIEVVQKAGGRAGIARTPDEAIIIIQELSPPA
jgi:hypothetical protein